MLQTIRTKLEFVLSFLAKTPKDKVLHMLGGLLIFDISRYFINDHITIGLVVVIAVLKEVYDFYSPKHTSDVYDFVATISLPTIMYILSLIAN